MFEEQDECEECGEELITDEEKERGTCDECEED